MGALVLGSVLIYSLYLPQAAPKQITLAVMPFAENGEFTPLSVGFSTTLRDAISLSRDVAVVDAVSTYAVMWDSAKATGMSHILALTHFVDGELRTVDGELQQLDYRVVNVSQPNWKEVLNGTITEFDDERTLQHLRDATTVRVRESIYDNSYMRTESQQYDTAIYREYLHELGAWFLEYKDATLLSSMHEVFDAKAEQLYRATGVASDPNRALWESVAQFEMDRNVRDYRDSLWQIAGEYPNGLAALSLGALALDLGHLRLAEHMWLRVARIRPQSAFAALNIAHVRRLLDDAEGTEQAFRIAELRDDLNVVGYFLELDRLAVNGDTTSTMPKLSGAGLDELQEVSSKSIQGDFQLSALMHLGRLHEFDPSIVATNRLWRTPPLWLSPEDERWITAQSFLSANFPSVSVPLAEDLLLDEPSVEEISAVFMPRRLD